MTLVEAETLALKLLKQVMEEKMNSTNIQVASVTKEKGFIVYNDEQVQEIIARL